MPQKPRSFYAYVDNPESKEYPAERFSHRSSKTEIRRSFNGAPALMKLITTFPLQRYDIPTFGLRMPLRASEARRGYYDSPRRNHVITASPCCSVGCSRTAGRPLSFRSYGVSSVRLPVLAGRQAELALKGAIERGLGVIAGV